MKRIMLIALLALAVIAPETSHAQDYGVVVRLYDYTNDAVWGQGIRNQVDYFNRIWGSYEYVFEYYRMEYIADSVTCLNTPTPQVGVRFCEDYLVGPRASAYGTYYEDNGDGNWAWGGGISFHQANEPPGVVQRAENFTCHEMGHIIGALPHSEKQQTKSCMNTARAGRHTVYTDAEIVQAMQQKPTNPPPSAGG